MTQNKYALVAQLDRVLGYEPRGQGFESLQACHEISHICLHDRCDFFHNWAHGFMVY